MPPSRPSAVVQSLLAGLGLSLAVLPLGAQQSPAPASTVHGINRADLDTTCAACQDFYQFATGGWRTANPAPAAFPRWGTFNILEERDREIEHQVLESAASSAKSDHPTTAIDKVGVYYATCMDSAGAESEGLSPVKPELARIAAITTIADVRREAARLQSVQLGVPFRIGVEQDDKDSREQILTVQQGGLGLPDRSYYLKADSASAATRTAYIAHIVRELKLAGQDSAAAQSAADRVMALETALARDSRPPAERRDPVATYHRMPITGAQAIAPRVEWVTWLADAGAPKVQSLNVADPDFFRGLDTLLVAVPVADWRDYLRARYLEFVAPRLDSRFVNEAFQQTRLLTGATEILPRWNRCVVASDRSMGEALGQAYVARTFSPAAKARAVAMVRNMEAVLREDLNTLTWMSPATRAQAIIKLDAFANKIGYPDRWRDYSALVIERRPFVENALAANTFEFRRRMAKIGQPVDRAEWGITPATVDAFYGASLNEITFPAGILQPPFFDSQADDAVNYGGVGAVIGHEMTHGFDDEGRQFDAQGNLRDWWTAEDGAGFQQRAGLIISQFDHYVAIDTLHVNGSLTQGENIADLGGLKVAFAALERSLQGKPRPAIDGFTPEQRFFLAWARIWAENRQPALARQLVLVDPHAPDKWRVDGPLSNMPEFAAAFHCQASDPMVRPADQRVSIW
jgi:putative endopeptidase